MRAETRNETDRVSDMNRHSSPSARRIIRKQQLRLEPLEDRRLLAVFMVENLLDGPVNALDDRDEASTWARKALDVAVQARRAKVKSPRRTTF